ncbi:hypothetical protein [Sphingomonas sp.]|uniref:hypothetical protein n=1 Tax=Sphingomonas sp. TaxID=28214 RepID=UPI003B00E12C
MQHLADQLLDGIQRHGIDVDQRQLPPVRFAGENDVGYQALREDGAARSDQHQLMPRHRTHPSCASTANRL